jgi:hypothetical protein
MAVLEQLLRRNVAPELRRWNQSTNTLASASITIRSTQAWRIYQDSAFNFLFANAKRRMKPVQPLGCRDWG